MATNSHLAGEDEDETVWTPPGTVLLVKGEKQAQPNPRVVTADD